MFHSTSVPQLLHTTHKPHLRQPASHQIPRYITIAPPITHTKKTKTAKYIKNELQPARHPGRHPTSHAAADANPSANPPSPTAVACPADRQSAESGKLRITVSLQMTLHWHLIIAFRISTNPQQNDHKLSIVIDCDPSDETIKLWNYYRETIFGHFSPLLRGWFETCWTQS